MIQYQQVGNPKPVCKILTTTGVTALYKPTRAQLRGALESIAVCNVSGGAVTFTLQVTDSTPATFKIASVSISAGATFFFNQHNIPILTNWALEAQASTANALHITAVILEQTPSEGSNT